MGVNLKPLVSKTPLTLRKLEGGSVAIDAYNTIYQFLAIIRQPNGTPLKDNLGRITSHLSGLLYRTSNLVEMGIRVVYVFDGKPPKIKEAVIQNRMESKKQAIAK